jgi:Flp pilus assembly protein TadG
MILKRIKTVFSRAPRLLTRHALREQTGAAALEFALILPIFGMIFAGAADFGAIICTKLSLESTVSSASNYVLVNAANVAPATATSLATSVAAIASGDWADATVTVNAGPTQTTTPTTGASSGATAPVGSCYCPTVVSDAVVWGSVVTCASTCPGGGLAGKFVTISASRAYRPLFVGYGLVAQGQISVRAVVQAQ